MRYSNDSRSKQKRLGLNVEFGKSIKEVQNPIKK